jgi:WD40 repeat protein
MALFGGKAIVAGYFAQDSPKSSILVGGIWQWDLKTGRTFQLVPPSYEGLYLGPGSIHWPNVYYVGDESVFRLDLRTRAIKKLAESNFAGPVAVSTDGRYLAYGDGNFNLHLLNLSTNEDRIIEDHQAYVPQVRFAPHSNDLYFLADQDRDENYKLLKYNIPSGSLSQILAFKASVG